MNANHFENQSNSYADLSIVIPAESLSSRRRGRESRRDPGRTWIPACAGMTIAATSGTSQSSFPRRRESRLDPGRTWMPASAGMTRDVSRCASLLSFPRRRESRPSPSSLDACLRRHMVFLSRFSTRSGRLSVRLDTCFIEQLHADNLPGPIHGFDRDRGVILVLAHVHVPPMSNGAHGRPL